MSTETFESDASVPHSLHTPAQDKPEAPTRQESQDSDLGMRNTSFVQVQNQELHGRAFGVNTHFQDARVGQQGLNF